MKGIMGILFAAMFILAACEIVVEQPSGERIAGSYESTQGVMDELSCYCENSGYVTDESEERTPVCFRQLEKVKCNYIEVWAESTVKSIVPPINSACPVGEMEYYQVNSYTCLDEMPQD